MKYKFFHLLTKLVLKYRLYYLWSKVYQWVWERKYRDYQLSSIDSMAYLEEFISRMEWREDTGWMLWDAISLPQATCARWKNGEKAGDCDDISLYAVNRMEDMFMKGKLNKMSPMGLLSVPWITASGEIR